MFDIWLNTLKNKIAKVAITTRIQRVELGNFGDVSPVGEGISELRIHTGAGYRIYYKQIGRTIVILLCGGDKSSQDRDIKRAKAMAVEIEKAEGRAR